MNDVKTQIAIVTPSFIGSARRETLAREALRQLQVAAGTNWPMIVVDDLPRTRRRYGRLPNLFHWQRANRVYTGDHIQLVRQSVYSSKQALLRATQMAGERGFTGVFIHLDDNCYVPLLSDLLRYAAHALVDDPDLMAVRLSGYPIISKHNTSKQGNLTQVTVVDDRVRFDGVELQPKRHTDYTLWWADFDAHSMDGNFWALAMWSTVYRVHFLERVLTLNPDVWGLRHLNQVEQYYRDHWPETYPLVEGKLGFINMQFGGLEMERNPNWQMLLSYPNIAQR